MKNSAQMCFSDDAVGAQDFYGKSESKEPAEESTESTSFTLEDPFEAFTAEDIWEGDPQQKIQEADVVCGRGKIAFNHQGNKRFRDAVANAAELYTQERNLHGKPAVVQSIIDRVSSSGGRFLKRDRHLQWVELTAQEQKDKVRRAIRDVATDIEKKASSLFRSPS